MKRLVGFLMCLAVLSMAGSAGADTLYKVQRGDSLKKISQKFYGNTEGYDWIAEHNNLRRPYRLLVGQVLTIPLGENSATAAFGSALSTAPPVAAAAPDQAPVEKPMPALVQTAVVTPAVVQAPVVATAPKGQPPVAKEKDDNNFVELDLSVGGWRNVKYDTEGVWGEGELIYWFGFDSTNLGLGPIVKYDWGHSRTNSDVKWGYTAPGLELGLWTALSEDDYFLLKPRLTYRMNNEGSDKADGLMPGYYLEYTHVLGGRDSVLLASSGWFFKNDNFLDARVYLDHKFSRNLEGKLGIGPVFHWTDCSSFTSISPAVSLKFGGTFTLGFVAEFSEEGPAYGAFLSAEFDTSK